MKTIAALIFSFVGVCCGAASSSEGAPFKLETTDGKTYQQVKIIHVEPDGLRITHATGAAKIGFEVLSDSVRREYGYNEKEARAFREAKEKEMDTARANAVRAELALQNEKEAAAFKLFRDRIMATIVSWNYDFVQLDGLLGQWITAYSKAGHEDWAAELTKDREFLRNQEKERPLRELTQRTKALEEENRKLAAQLGQLQQDQTEAEEESRRVRRVTYVESYPYWYLNYNVPYLPTAYPSFVRPQPCPPAKSVAIPAAATVPCMPSNAHQPVRLPAVHPGTTPTVPSVTPPTQFAPRPVPTAATHLSPPPAPTSNFTPAVPAADARSTVGPMPQSGRFVR